MEVDGVGEVVGQGEHMTSKATSDVAMAADGDEPRI